MKIKLILLLAILICLSCSKDEQMIIDDCQAINGLTIISQSEVDTLCSYNLVYQYQSEIFTTCVCCVCDKIFMAFDCNNEPLCDFDENCMQDFDRNAQFLFFASPG